MIITKLVLTAITVTSIILPTALPAQEIRVEIGDRPYYTHGARYWRGEYEMIWVPGHWSDSGRWIHGHYRRGEHRRHHRHHHHDHDDNHHHDRDHH